jgi:hypothetical protein
LIEPDESAMSPRDSLVYLCSVEFLGNAIRVDGYLQADVYSSDEQVTEHLRERGRLCDLAVEIIGRWIEGTESCMGDFFPEIGLTTRKAFFEKHYSWSDRFVPVFGGELINAVYGCQPRVAVSRDVLIYLCYCKTLAAIIGKFDETVMRVESDHPFRKHVEAYRPIWLHAASLLEKEWLKDFQAGEDEILREMLGQTASHVCALWRASIEEAVDELQKTAQRKES